LAGPNSVEGTEMNEWMLKWMQFFSILNFSGHFELSSKWVKQGKTWILSVRSRERMQSLFLLCYLILIVITIYLLLLLIFYFFITYNWQTVLSVKRNVTLWIQRTNQS
jgi:hypothetical protein